MIAKKRNGHSKVSQPFLKNVSINQNIKLIRSLFSKNKKELKVFGLPKKEFLVSYVKIILLVEIMKSQYVKHAQCKQKSKRLNKMKILIRKTMRQKSFIRFRLLKSK